ncbi:hypothetical protein HOA91_00265 [Candidatus Woesearchaeota archaeon]|nr:hypothetical protein [Candidatus Woesearchaeota archaeon]
MELTDKVFELTPEQERQIARKEPLAPKEMLGAKDHLSFRSYLIVREVLMNPDATIYDLRKAGIPDRSRKNYH